MKPKICIPETSIYSKGWAIIFQVVLIFFFLTLFFFLYVSQVEKIEFKKQMDIIVDDMAQEVELDVPKSTQSSSYTIVNGILDYQEENIKITSKNTIASIREKNKKIITTAVNALVIVSFVVIAGLLSLFLVGYCFPIKKHFINALIAVVVVGSVELFFLLVIAKNFISANPKQFRQTLGNALIKYVDGRKK